MYKALEQSIRDSDKLADLSDFAYRVWVQGLAASDMVGRITGNPKTFWAQAMPLTVYDQQKISGALKELVDAKLVHKYDVDGKVYLVFHDHEDYNKGTKNLRHPPKSKIPPPPQSLCFCVTYQDHEDEGATAVPTAVETAVPTAIVHVPPHVPVLVPVPEGVQGEPPDSPESRLFRLAIKAKVIAASERQLRTHIGGWLADKGFQFLEALLMNPAIRGKDVFFIHETYFKALRNGKPPPGARRKVIDRNCEKCGGKGRRLNPVTNAEMDCGCVREVPV